MGKSLLHETYCTACRLSICSSVELPTGLTAAMLYNTAEVHYCVELVNETENLEQESIGDTEQKQDSWRLTRDLVAEITFSCLISVLISVLVFSYYSYVSAIYVHKNLIDTELSHSSN